MNILRNEIRTGLLVVLSLAALVAVLLYLGAPGVFIPQNTYRIYFDDAGGIKPGAQILLAGRRIGQVRTLFSPVPEKDRPMPNMEVLIEIQVERSAKIFNKVKVQIAQPSVLGESVIDFSNGQEASGLAKDGTSFLGERPGGLADLAPKVMAELDPVLAKLTATLESLQKTSDNLAKLTTEGADLPAAFTEFKTFGANLNDMSAYGGPLRNSLQNIETLTSEQGKLGQSVSHLAELTGPEGSLAKSFKNAEKFTADLTADDNAAKTLRNFRKASDTLDQTLTQLGQQFGNIGNNLEQATDTVKRQPWRLIWPTTKKYPEPAATPMPVKRATLVKKAAASR